ncbi:hypothetical protein TSUD_202540 [Trifolium subterraneum]|uniref:Uncharacterized protein n=1 Tax=Trifolium subterraneum TaxID=3900 RepID=A0A2Z6MQ86_TRISU|nr:hypothetical protein TSUD_202540 [Trifolium subterraneum]
MEDFAKRHHQPPKHCQEYITSKMNVFRTSEGRYGQSFYNVLELRDAILQNLPSFFKGDKLVQIHCCAVGWTRVGGGVESEKRAKRTLDLNWNVYHFNINSSLFALK